MHENPSARHNPVATVDGDKPRVRPFGFMMKEVYKQLKQNPNIEISVMGSDGGSWLRVKGAIAFDESRDAKAQAFEESPNLLRIYPKGADDDVFVTFYFTSAEARLFSFAAAPKDVPLF